MGDLDEKIRKLKNQFSDSFTCSEGSSMGTYVVERNGGYHDEPIALEEEVEVSGFSVFGVDTSSWAPKVRVNPRCKYLNSEDHGSSSNSLECTNKKSIEQTRYTCYSCPHAQVFDV